MGGANRFMTLLTAPFPPIRPSLIVLHRRSRSLSTTPLRLLTIDSPSKTETRTQLLVKSFHTQSSNNPFQAPSSAAQQQRHHPWPEWTHFLNVLSNGQGFPANLGIPPEDAFVVYEELTADFVSSAGACLAFSRSRPSLLGSLSRRDIEAVVSNGTPFLFKSALDTARRMRAFLGTDGSNVPDFDKANTVDLMKYILSYASNPAVSSERNGLFSRELVDSSVRNLLHELGAVCSGVPTGNVPSSGHQFSGRDGQSQRPLGQNIEMKRGDWICPKCSFMNFARNMKCLECEESRPRKQLTGGEWECPECTFFNYGRNMVCLRCDCRRPGAPLFNTNNSQFGSGHNGDYSYKTNMDYRPTGNEERAQQWFSKISQMNNATDSNNGNIKVTTNSTLDTSANHSMDHNLSQSKRDQTSEMDDRNKAPIAVHETVASETRNQSQIDIGNKDRVEQAEKSERWFKKMAEMHDVKDLPSAVSDEDFPEIMPIRQGENRFVVSKKKDRSLTSPKYKRQVAIDQGNSTNFVPFVPFPPGYFAKKDTEQINGPDSPAQAINENDQRSTSSVNASEIVGGNQSEVPRMHNQSINSTSSELAKNENVRSSWTGTSLEGSAVKETDPLDMSEEAKAERWFKRVAQIKDISELSQIPDEDFPSIMPMRKGVNRFVVSKRKTPLERRLTSQQYRRNLPIVSTDSVNKESDNS